MLLISQTCAATRASLSSLAAEAAFAESLDPSSMCPRPLQVTDGPAGPLVGRPEPNPLTLASLEGETAALLVAGVCRILQYYLALLLPLNTVPSCKGSI